MSNLDDSGGADYSHVSASGSAHQHNGNIYGSVTNNFHGLAIREDKDEARQGVRNVHWLVKRRTNALFTGQEDILKNLEEALGPGSEQPDGKKRQFVLHGIGGVGKSELALQYAERHRAKYWGVFWIDFGSLGSAQQSFAGVAKKCGWAVDATDDLIEDVVSHLSEAEQSWLLILDNCDDPRLDYDLYFPYADHGAVLMTSRLDIGETYGTAGKHHMAGLENESALTLLEKTSKLDIRSSEANMMAAMTILRQLGSHALAITVAGSLLKTGAYQIEEYSNVLSRQVSRLLHERPKQAKSTYGTIHSTFEVSAERLQADSQQDEASKHALELLGVLAHLNRTSVPEDLFTRAWSWGHQYRYDEKHVDLENDPSNDDWDLEVLSQWQFDGALSFEWARQDTPPSKFRNARARLLELSLVTYIAESNAVVMHPLLHSWARSRLSTAEQGIAWRQAACTLALSVENNRDWKDFSPSLRPHCEECVKLMPTDVATRFEHRDLSRTLQLLWCQLYQTHSPQTSALLEWICTLIEMKTISRQPELSLSQLRILHMKGACYASKAKTTERQEDWERALKCCLEEEAALKKRKESLKQEHEYARREIASCLIELGRGEEAIHMLKLLLQELESETSPGMKLVALCWRDLSLAYKACGRSQESLNAIEKAVSIKESILSEEDPSVLVSRHALAQAHLRLRNYGTAIEILEDVIRVASRFQDDPDSSLLASQSELGRAYLADSQPQKALHLLESVAVRKAETLHSEHPSHLKTLYFLARCYRDVGQLEQAIMMLEGIVAIRKTIMPHYDDLQYYWLLVCYIEDERVSQARHLFDRIMETAESLPEDAQQDLAELRDDLQKLEGSDRQAEAQRIAEGDALFAAAIGDNPTDLLLDLDIPPPAPPVEEKKELSKDKKSKDSKPSKFDQVNDQLLVQDIV